MPQQPRETVETFQPVLPSRRYCTRSSWMCGILESGSRSRRNSRARRANDHHRADRRPADAVLREPATDSEVQVVLDIGANVQRFRTRVGGRPVEVLAPAPDAAALRERPTRSGSAPLFPYPGRIEGGRFDWRGREIQLATGPDGNAIHGFARARPFALRGQTPRHDRGRAEQRGRAAGGVAVPLPARPDDLARRRRTAGREPGREQRRRADAVRARLPPLLPGLARPRGLDRGRRALGAGRPGLPDRPDRAARPGRRAAPTDPAARDPAPDQDAGGRRAQPALPAPPGRHPGPACATHGAAPRSS